MAYSIMSVSGRFRDWPLTTGASFPARIVATAIPMSSTIAALCLLLCGCNRTSPLEPAETDTLLASAPPGQATVSHEFPAGHLRMLNLLKQVAERSLRDHPYLGRQRARSLRAQIASFNKSTSAGLKWRTYVAAGRSELHLGNVRAAIDNLKKAYEVSREANLGARQMTLTRLQLGTAYLRLGEDQNCCLRHTPESCILPIRGGGVHTRQEGSRQAIRYFSEMLAKSSGKDNLYYTARWLLNIAYMTIEGYPHDVPDEYLIPEKAFESNIDFPRFINIAPSLGLDSFNLSGGAIIDDFDGDDYLDIVTSTWDTTGQMHFFRNNRDGTFTDRTEPALLSGLYGGLNAVQADYDNDGYVDILVLRGAWAGYSGRHPNSLLRNNGDGTFTDVTFAAGLGDVHYPTQTAGWADYDNDGYLDLYIGNESSVDFSAPCQLFHNNGDGTFVDVAAQAGVENGRYTKGVAWGDYDGDRLPDLYVSNFSGRNRLYRNNGDGTFSDVALQLRVEKPLSSFPVWFWDFDNDGALDLFVASYTGGVGIVGAYHLGLPAKYEKACLYRGDGNGDFQEVAAECNLTYPMLPMGSNFGDLNNDGYLDFYLGTGDPDYSSLMPNLMFLNRQGREFTNVTMAGGFGHLQKGHAVVFADLDNDGDLDVFEQMGGAYPGDKFSDALYENPGFGHHWITIKLVGRRSNRSAIGARLHIRIIENGKERSIFRHVTSGGSFGANPLRQTIGLGSASVVSHLNVYWPTTGMTQSFHTISADQAIQIVEGQDNYTTLKLKRLLFKTESKEM